MTSKAKYILFGVLGMVLGGGALVLGAALVIGIFYFAAQADETKVENKNAAPKIEAASKPYKQSDIDGLIKFHEWAAETKFTSEERQKFESFVGKDFQNNAEKARKDTDGLIDAYAQIQKTDKNTQELTRQLLVPATIEDLRKKTDDFSKFLLQIYEKKSSNQRVSDKPLMEKITSRENSAKQRSKNV